MRIVCDASDVLQHRPREKGVRVELTPHHDGAAALHFSNGPAHSSAGALSTSDFGGGAGWGVSSQYKGGGPGYDSSQGQRAKVADKGDGTSLLGAKQTNFEREDDGDEGRRGGTEFQNASEQKWHHAEDTSVEEETLSLQQVADSLQDVDYAPTYSHSIPSTSPTKTPPPDLPPVLANCDTHPANLGNGMRREAAGQFQASPPWTAKRSTALESTPCRENGKSARRRVDV